MRQTEGSAPIDVIRGSIPRLMTGTILAMSSESTGYSHVSMRFRARFARLPAAALRGPDSRRCRTAPLCAVRTHRNRSGGPGVGGTCRRSACLSPSFRSPSSPSPVSSRRRRQPVGLAAADCQPSTGGDRASDRRDRRRPAHGGGRRLCPDRVHRRATRRSSRSTATAAIVFQQVHENFFPEPGRRRHRAIRAVADRPARRWPDRGAPDVRPRPRVALAPPAMSTSHDRSPTRRTRSSRSTRGGLKKVVTVYALGMDAMGGPDDAAPEGSSSCSPIACATSMPAARSRSDVYAPTGYRGILIEREVDPGVDSRRRGVALARPDARPTSRPTSTAKAPSSCRTG